jgi:preprotein translocase subunit SecA
MEISQRINEIYSSLQSVDSDKLRELFNLWKNGMPQWDEDNTIIHLFALIKELCRRFALGPISVKANDFDRAVADYADYVKIDSNGLAIYSNQWLVGETQYIWNMIPYDEQLLAGYHIAKHTAVQLATGEGKTLVSIFPAIYMSLSKKGIHLITVNGYLSKRDYEITSPLYAFWGIKTACIENSKCNSTERKDAYSADVTFGAVSTIIFDYLFDNMAISASGIKQRGLNAAIIDELDSVLIDDADQLHIISSGDGPDISKELNEAKKIVIELIKENTAYEVDNISKRVTLTPIGESLLCNLLTKYQTFDKDVIRPYVQIMLIAYLAFQKDVDYIVDKGKVVIIDINTGRPRYNSRWENGIHAAVECKEGVEINKETYSSSFISIKNFFKKYSVVTGMSGTLVSAQDELKNIHNLNIVAIPSHKPCIREDFPIQMYQHYVDKIDSIVCKVMEIHQSHRPILLCCSNIAESQKIGNLLRKEGLSPQILTPQNIERESLIINQAGQCDSITVSTNLVGRGADIILSQEAISAGGLYVIGSNLYKSNRIDLQLAGRAGRQGQPGSSMFFASAEDEIFTFNKCDSQISKESLKQAQSLCEIFYYDQRRAYERKDDLIDPTRDQVFKIRRQILNTSNILDLDLFKEYSINTELLQNIHQERCVPYILKFKQNNKIDKYVFIPFSSNQHPFAIRFDIERGNDFEYFHEEYIKQAIIQTYNLFWNKILSCINPSHTDDCDYENAKSQLESLHINVRALLKNRLSSPYCLLPRASSNKEEATGKSSLVTYSSHRRIR